ncbi:FUSC family membrane protein [Hymenobacter weizhouensis]|uniref:FUSC family membrane protein n=1 Tax=Hymenobacter sp. YIM 151500-1 TaxID=2987689 RepID=UPI002227AC83|nr:FUSC family membrane protein [Hymenobacter sp. YIM 151500-1]UYZ62964.1 FUSC family protein [Hymenobacter sp. YIM 151500-1]
MNDRVRSVFYFFFTQEFSDGLRTTLAVLLPSLAAASVGRLPDGLPVSLGALCVSLADLPGPAAHKRNGLLAAIGLLFGVAVVTGLVQPYRWLLGLEIGVFSFVFTLLLVYGSRAAAVGTAGLLLAIVLMDQPLPPARVLPHAGLVTLGGGWYLLVRLGTQQLWPYRAAQQALGECIRAVAEFLRLKAEFYRTGTRLDDDFRRLVAQQVTVSEKQDAVRELLFKTRQLVQDTTGTGRRLVLTFVDLVDLYEQITVTYYDYADLHRQFEASGVLDAIADLVDALAAELENMGYAVQANHGYRSQAAFGPALEQLKARIDGLPQEPARTRVLRKILVNLRTLTQRLEAMRAYFDGPAPEATGRELEFGRFVDHQRFDLKLLQEHLTLSSGIFRHSVRMMLACLVAFVVAEVVLPGHHSYWILMTVTYMLKPAYSLTKQRNVQRVLGTLAGGAAGALVLWLVPDRLVLLVLMSLCMLVSFSFARINYLVAVSFMTPFVLILFSFLGLSYLQVAEERVLDTVVGCAIAFAASYLLFPRWESEQLQDHLTAVLRANLRYLHTLAELLAGTAVALTDYKLVRKQVYVSSANLAAAFQRMLSEPRAKQHRPTEVHELVVLNHLLSSNVSAVASARLPGPGSAVPPDALRPLRHAQLTLHRALRRLNPQEPDLPPAPASVAAPEAGPPDATLAEQLDFIQKLSADVGKVTEAVLR